MSQDKNKSNSFIDGLGFSFLYPQKDMELLGIKPATEFLWDQTNPMQSPLKSKEVEQDNIRKMQLMLYDAGFLTGNHDKVVDGLMGRNTELAKNKYIQSQLIKHGFLNANLKNGRSAIDGILGKASQVALENAKAKGYIINSDGSITIPNQNLGNTSSKRSFSFANAAEPYGMAALALVERKLDKKDSEKKSSNKQSEENNSETLQYFTNFLRNPIAATIDYSLSAADRAGIPTNASNYLRDLNANLGYRISSAVRGGVNTLFNGKPYRENVNRALANPTFIEDFMHIRPISVTEENFNPEELEILSKMAGDKMYITDADIKRETPDGKYGAYEGVGKYFTPHKIVQTSIGKSSGNKEQGYITDLFDVNTLVEKNSAADNDMYLKAALENPGFNYQTLRATMPFTSSIDIMPDKYKIASKIQLK